MFFNLSEQILFATASILQDAFSGVTFNKNSFTTANVTDEEEFPFTWKKNKDTENSLYITEQEPFEIQKFPQICMFITSSEMKNLAFDQYMESYKDPVTGRQSECPNIDS